MNFKKILIAVDPSEYSARAVSYVAVMAEKMTDCSITILLIERIPDRDMYAREEDWKADCRLEAEACKKFLTESCETLMNAGIPSESVSEQFITSCRSPIHENEDGECSMGTSIAEDILGVQREGGYGTLVVGRRGVSKAEEFLFGSVSKKVVHEARDCTVWVVE